MESNKTKKKVNVMKQREINGNTILYLGKIFNTRYDGLYEEKNFRRLSFESCPCQVSKAAHVKFRKSHFKVGIFGLF
jgi:hypothetical protein